MRQTSSAGFVVVFALVVAGASVDRPTDLWRAAHVDGTAESAADD